MESTKMPIYEYWCQGCKKKVEILSFHIGDKSDVACPRCGGKDLRRLISRFVSLRSEESRLEAMTDPSNLSGLDEKDPASMARWLKKMGRELGEDIKGEEIDQMADEIASGKGLDEGSSFDGETGGCGE
jgi:putative FmdB family regulatory protein